MKVLYLTDLDGTLLNSDAQLSEFSKKGLNKLIDNGINFSVATARTFATVSDLFCGVNLKLPYILMNGVVIFDPITQSNISIHSIDNESAKKILDCYKKHNKAPMLYFMRDGYIEIIYSTTENPYQMNYVSNRDSLKRKVFNYKEDYEITDSDNLIYMVTLDKHECANKIFQEISQTTNLTSMFYLDNYTDCYFLETFNGSVSKSSGALEIKKLLGFDKIVAFGDNLNDIPLFNVADESYAVSNAHNELKKIATGIIGSNDEDAVVKFLLERYGFDNE